MVLYGTFFILFIYIYIDDGCCRGRRREDAVERYINIYRRRDNNNNLNPADIMSSHKIFTDSGRQKRNADKTKFNKILRQEMGMASVRTGGESITLFQDSCFVWARVYCYM